VHFASLFLKIPALDEGNNSAIQIYYHLKSYGYIYLSTAPDLACDLLLPRKGIIICNFSQILFIFQGFFFSLLLYEDDKFLFFGK